METPITPTTVDESRFTPEQTLELARVRAETAQARALLAELEGKTQEAAAERTALQRREAESDALLACKVSFYNAGEALQMLTASPASDVRFDPATKTMTAIVGKERVPLSDALRQFALDHETLVDGRSLRHLKTATAPKAKSDMSMRERMAYIDEHGLDAFEKLPLRSVQTREIRTMADYAALPVATKTKLLAAHGPKWLASLPRK